MKTSAPAPLLVAAGCLVLLSAGDATAGSRTVRAGEAVGVSEDVVLSGDDVLEVGGTAEKHCRLDGNGQQIRTTADWRGHVRIRYCEFRGLGSAKSPALDLTANGDGDKIVIEHCDFHACGAVHLTNNDTSATVFRDNTIHANSMVPVTNLPSESPPGFRAGGRSPAAKFFQGNRIAKSVVLFENTRRWLIGGDRDEDANVLVGMRASLTLHGCSDVAVRGNYIHTEIPSFRWSQVHTLAVNAAGTGLVIEHNVFRHGQWVVRGLAGEFRYNLVLDADAHNFIIGPTAGTHIHHNIFARYCTVDPNLNSTIAVIYKGDDIQIYNNTFDGGGKDLARVWHVPAIEVGPDGFVSSLRNNVFCNHPTRFAGGTATVRPGFAEKTSDPAPARLGYADYNLFYNPDAAEKRNYALAVAGKTLRADAGFGKHDVPADGAADAQVEPRFAGPIPKQFPFSDDDIWSGKVPVSRVLARYRDAYAPADGSPLRDAGDPADGKGSYIGAVGGGEQTPNDHFGRPGAGPAADRNEEAVAPTEPVRLFNGRDLTGLHTWLRDTHREDPRRVFRVEDGVIHISGDGFGYLATDRAYRDYHLIVEYKWGQRTDGGKFVRNSGVLLHGTGPDGGANGTWMSCFECQLAQGCNGDLIVIRGKDDKQQTIPVRLTADVVLGPDRRPRWQEGGEKRTFTGGQLWWSKHDPDFKELLDTRGKNDVESPLGEWTRVECICEGSTITVLINGTVVNKAYDVFPSSGHILLQCEGFELYVRTFELRPLKK